MRSLSLSPRALAFLPASELLLHLRAGRVTSVDLTRTYLDRIAKHNSKLNAVVTLNPHALHRAEELDRQLDSENPAGRLHGLPITVKDAFATAGLKTTSGMKNRAHHVPEQNTVSLQRLLDQGCVLLGKTNVPPMITGQETSNAIFGRSHNPFDLARMTGGSSVGAAAAIAAGLSALEIGSDSGGLIRRQPASYCGVFGHYPTHGLVPIRGHLPSISMEAYGKDVDFLGVGPIARSAEDLLECALDILACPDPVDSPHVKFTLQDGLGEKKVSNYKIAAWFDDEACGADPQVSSVLKKLISSLRAAGAKADLKARPHFDLADARNLAFSLWVSASSTPHLTPDALKKYEHISRTDSNGPALSRLRARSELLRHAEWLQLDTRRHSYSEAWSEFFSRYDVLLTPVSPVLAPFHDPASDADPDIVASLDHRLELTLPSTGEHARRPYVDQIVWPTLAGMCGLPATVFPAGREEGTGMPVGVQVVGARGGDRRTVGFARAVEKKIGGFKEPEGFE